ncbi:MAG: ketoacyl-ACP synthase III [Spirochaetales bacterium]|nr:ketoacyl-ACP synthase III [Spirochaetales bacterium]
MRNVAITAVGSYLPPRIMTNDELAGIVDTSDEWIVSHTGIGTRHIAEGETTSEMAIKATENLIKRFKIDPERIDGVIVATATGDYPGFPSTANLVSRHFKTKGGAFDLAAGCTGFIYALDVARSMILSGTLKNALVIGSEALSTVIDWEDRNTCVLFGDGAAAVLLEQAAAGGLAPALLRSEAMLAESLTIDPVSRHITMDGKAVYQFAVRAIGEIVTDVLKAGNLSISEIDWIVPHQANRRIISATSRRYEIPEELFYLNIERVANTSAASIPLALSEMEASGLLKEGRKILLVGFGAGLTYGGSLLTWQRS